jgi:hypothetical protein
MALALALPALPQLLPDHIMEAKLKSTAPAPVAAADQPVWNELGLQDSGTGFYEAPNGKYTLTLYRVQDPTAALAAYDWQRPADARPNKLAPLAADTPDGMIVGAGNYLALWKGHKPTPEELNGIMLTIPRYQHGNLPGLPGFMPGEGLKSNSERYIIGPATLARFYPEIPPSAAAFHLSGEAESAQFGPTKLIIFSYPTFEIARKQAAVLGKIPGAITKRSGQLVAVTVNPPDADQAEHVLSRVRYQADVTVPEKPPTKKDNPVNLLLNIALLVLILIVFCALSGLAFGGMRQLFHRFGPGDDGESMLTLHLNDRR